MGVYTSERVMQGTSDSVAHCQNTVQEMFKTVLYKGMLAWLDDLLGYAKDTIALLVIMRKGFSICREKGLKLNALKCSFWETEAK